MYFIQLALTCFSFLQLGKNPLLCKAENEDMDLWENTNPDTVKLEDGFRGLRIKLPMKAETVVKLTEYYKYRRVSIIRN